MEVSPDGELDGLGHLGLVAVVPGAEAKQGHRLAGVQGQRPGQMGRGLSLYQGSFDHVKVGPTPALALQNL